MVLLTEKGLGFRVKFKADGDGFRLISGVFGYKGFLVQALGFSALALGA